MALVGRETPARRQSLPFWHRNLTGTCYTAAMPCIEKHAPGSFCWMELATTDQAAAKAFYSSLFGWQPIDMPMGPDEYYTMFNLNGGQVGAAYTIKPHMGGAPPHWGLYIAVTSADETAAKAAAAGGKVLSGPFDVMRSEEHT